MTIASLVPRCSGIHLDDSEHDSGSDVERDPEVASTTSLEDISKLHPDMLLYKAARARNLPVMLEAISLGANPNWKNEEEEGRTALIQAVHSVRQKVLSWRGQNYLN